MFIALYTQIPNEQVQIIYLSVTVFSHRIFNMSYPIHLDKASATTFSDPGTC